MELIQLIKHRYTEDHWSMNENIWKWLKMQLYRGYTNYFDLFLFTNVPSFWSIAISPPFLQPGRSRVMACEECPVTDLNPGQAS